jgi:hypothetical protein
MEYILEFVIGWNYKLCTNNYNSLGGVTACEIIVGLRPCDSFEDTIKPTHKLTSIKQSLVLKGHPFLVLS